MTKLTGSDSKSTLYCSFCGKSQHEVRKLIAGRVDFICLPRGVGFYLLRQNGEDPKRYEFSVFTRDGQAAAISHRSRYPSLFDDFQRGLRAIKRNGTYDRIVAGFTD